MAARGFQLLGRCWGVDIQRTTLLSRKRRVVVAWSRFPAAVRTAKESELNKKNSFLGITFPRVQAYEGRRYYCCIMDFIGLKQQHSIKTHGNRLLSTYFVAVVR